MRVAVTWARSGTPVLARLIAFLMCASAAQITAAQQLGVPQSEILTISSERVYSESEFGKRIAREIDEQSAELAAENRSIEAELTQEEHDLTERRESMQPDEFRKLADAFDTKVQRIRSTQDAKARAIVQRNDEARAQFFDAARPVLAALMRETGAGVILERSSVFLSANTTDITEVAIARINAAMGDGSRPEPAPKE